MIYSLEFEIPALPPTPNLLLGAHWRVRSGHAKQWKAWVGYAIIGKRPSLTLVKAKITLTRYSSREPDSDGLRGSFKFILDALVHHRVIEDDKPANIGEPKVLWEKAPPKKGRITVMVEGDA